MGDGGQALLIVVIELNNDNKQSLTPFGLSKA